MTADLFTRKSTCRLCGTGSLVLAMPLFPSVPVDNYRPRLHRNIDSKTYSMDLYRCESCGHAQLRGVVDPAVLFGDYIYTSTSSPGLERHFRELVDQISRNIPLTPDDLVIDVGCNDGLLLQMFRQRGQRTFGIDPSAAALHHAKARGLSTLQAFLTVEGAQAIAAEHGLATLVTATNVFSHADDLDEFATAVGCLLRPGGSFVFEVSYLKNLLFSGVWDYIYHEHLAHHSVKPLDAFLRKHDLLLQSAEQIPAKGGSLRCIARKCPTSGLNGNPHLQIRNLIREEELLGLYGPDPYRRLVDFKRRLNHLTRRILDALPAHSAICSYGASATSTVLSQELEYAHRIAYAVDDNTARQRTLTPGYLTPVVGSQELDARFPRLLIISAWRFRADILPRCQTYLSRGGKVYIPLPWPSLITSGGEEFLEV
jgi:SAM-dependent methyltransferase